MPTYDLRPKHQDYCPRIPTLRRQYIHRSVWLQGSWEWLCKLQYAVTCQTGTGGPGVAGQSLGPWMELCVSKWPMIGHRTWTTPQIKRTWWASDPSQPFKRQGYESRRKSVTCWLKCCGAPKCSKYIRGRVTKLRSSTSKSSSLHKKWRCISTNGKPSRMRVPTNFFKLRRTTSLLKKTYSSAMRIQRSPGLCAVSIIHSTKCKPCFVSVRNPGTHLHVRIDTPAKPLPYVTDVEWDRTFEI